MRHIIVPLSDSLGERYDYLAAVTADEKSLFGMVMHTEDLQPALIQEGGEDACWMYSVCMTDQSAPDAFRAVFEALRSNIDPIGSETFTIDVIVDASHAEMAEKVLSFIRKAGQWYRVHLIFLSQRNSVYGRQQADLFTKIRNDASGKSEDSGLGWTWFTMLADENRNGVAGDMIRQQREKLLPFLLCSEHEHEQAKSCSTYAVDYLAIDDEQIPQIPKIQAIRYACNAIQAHEVYNEQAILLMNGDVCPDQTDRQRAILQDHLIEIAGIKTITGPDLLIHKHDPKADMTARELLDKLFQDNPEFDSRRYDQAVSEDQLKALPAVRMAVNAWEDYVIMQARRHTNPEKIRDQLVNDSEWIRKISKEFQGGYFADDPLQMCASVIRGKDGYEEKAGNAAASDMERVNQQLRDAFFQACLRLLVMQIRHTFTRINEVISERKDAIDRLLQSTAGYEATEKMIPGWCEWIQGKLTEISNLVPIDTIAADDSYTVLINYVDVLMEHLKNQVNIDEGYAEMASTENTDRLMRMIKETMSPVQMINASLTGGASIQRETWYVYDRLHAAFDAARIIRTKLPMMMRAIGYYLYPAAETAPDPSRDSYQEILFRPSVEVRMSIANRTLSKPQPQSMEEPPEQNESSSERNTGNNMRFNWDYPQSDTVNIRYYLFGSDQPLAEVQRSKNSYGGSFIVQPISTLPSGARIEIEVWFLKAGHEIGRVPGRIYYETEKLHLNAEEEIYTVKESLFKKVSYHRLRIRGVSSELTGRLAVRNAVSGCFCLGIEWTKDGADLVSEPLPEGGAWCLANRPESPYVYDLG